MLSKSEKKLYVIANSHMDPVWLWSRASGRSTWLNTMHSVVKMMERHPEMKFSCSSTALYRYVEECSPRLFADIRRLVCEGRWEIVGGWEVQADAIISDTESLLRQGMSGKEYIREKFGIDVTIGFSADSFGHSAHLPKILNATGFTHYVFLRPMSHQKNLPLLFDWRSEDGSQVRALRIFDTYNLQNIGKEEFLDRINLHLENGLPHQTLFLGTGDHGGGIYETHYQWLQEAAQNHDIVFSTLQEYFDVMKDDPVPCIENQELGPVFRGCYSACFEVKSKIAHAMQRMQIAEKTGAEKEELSATWQELLFHHFHDIITGTACLDAFEKDIFPALGSVIWKAEDQITHALNRRAECLDTSFVKEGGVYLWNPQNVPVTGLFAFPGFTDPNETGKDFNALEDQEGNVYPLQIVYQTPALFSPCAMPWGLLTGTVSLPAGGEKTLAFTRLPQETGSFLGFQKQHQLLQRLSFPYFHDDSGTWGFTMTDFLRPEACAELLRTEEFTDGPVCSILRAYYRLNRSEIRLDIWRFAGIDELKLSLRIDWQEKLSVLKIACSHGLDTPEFHTGTAAGGITRFTPHYPSFSVQIRDGRREKMQPRSGEISMQEWCAAFSAGKSIALYSADLHSCDFADAALRITLLRATPYSDHHPFPRNEETGFMDMGLNFRELWFAENNDATQETVPSRARRRLHNVECTEITGHPASSPVFSFDVPEVACSDKVVLEAARKLHGDTWELHLLNYGEAEQITLPDGRQETIPAKSLRSIVF